MHRIKYAILFAAIAVLAPACTKTFGRLAYNTLLPRIILQRIDKYFDLTGDQEAELKRQLNKHHAWHKQTQLKLYAADLTELKGRFSRNLSEADLNWLIQRLTLHRNTLFRRVIPDLVNLLRTLSPQQITHLQKALANENAELRKRLDRPLAERQNEEFSAIVKQIEDWTGRLSEAQKAQLRAKYAAIPVNVGDWLRYREEQQAIFIRLLQTKPDVKTLNADLEGRMIYQERNMPKHFQTAFARTATLMREMILTGDRLLTPEQRRHVTDKADEYIQLLHELAR